MMQKETSCYVQLPVEKIALILLSVNLFPVHATSALCPAVGGTQNSYHNPLTGTCYYVWHGQFTYSSAKNMCTGNGLHIVQLETAAELTWLGTVVNQQHWIGLEKTSGTWHWATSGDPVPATDPGWATGSPGSGNRAYKQTSTHWASSSSTASYVLVCEAAPGDTSSTGTSSTGTSSKGTSSTGTTSTIVPTVATPTISVPDCLPIQGSESSYRHPVTGACYYLWSGLFNYDNAKSTCKANGLFIVQLETMDEQNWLSALITQKHWMGLELGAAGNWRWKTNKDASPTTDSRWDSPISGKWGYKKSPVLWGAADQHDTFPLVCESRESLPCTGFRKVYFNKVNEMDSSIYHEALNVDSVQVCGIQCLKDQLCSGIIYDPAEKNCTFVKQSGTDLTCPPNSECYKSYPDFH